MFGTGLGYDSELGEESIPPNHEEETQHPYPSSKKGAEALQPFK
jgi:hypothetical protein